ncbi:hypothetical protein THRCLA_08154 [Thraustotheca clavata]|uniref:Uncharacterized protein n=1 Tax=Thraustotheca clavata TaxID=74557 RepID=A0A1V9Z9A0_9STRA|nr:hypothetical protein THRCLA_08154 [Thraustotheca clavata]
MWNVYRLSISSIQFQSTMSWCEFAASRSTGLRVYAGAHILIRFLTSPIGLELLDNASLVERGCGTGAVGSVAAVTANVKQVVVTDGDPRACELAKLNINHLVHERKPLLPATAMQMYWGNDPVPQAFDIGIGCELMYYKT